MDYHTSYWSNGRIVSTVTIEAASMREAAIAAVENNTVLYCDGLTVKLLERFECEPRSVSGALANFLRSPEDKS